MLAGAANRGRGLRADRERAAAGGDAPAGRRDVRQEAPESRTDTAGWEGSEILPPFPDLTFEIWGSTATSPTNFTPRKPHTPSVEPTLCTEMQVQHPFTSHQFHEDDGIRLTQWPSNTST